MEINKIKLNNQVVIDLTDLTVTPADVVPGKTFIDKYGVKGTGSYTLDPNFQKILERVYSAQRDVSVVYPFTKIGDYVLCNWSSLGSIDMKNVITISDYSAIGSDNLKTISNTDNVTYIGDQAFRNCPKLETMALNNGKITQIGTQAFQNCSQYVFGKITANTIKLLAFNNAGIAESNQTVFLQGSTAALSLESNIFAGCSSLKTIKIYAEPWQTPTINSNAFSNCSSLTDIYVSWDQGDVAGAPWGSNATIHYNSVYNPDGDPYPIGYVIASKGYYEYPYCNPSTATPQELEDNELTVDKFNFYQVSSSGRDIIQLDDTDIDTITPNYPYFSDDLSKKNGKLNVDIYLDPGSTYGQDHYAVTGTYKTTVVIDVVETIEE